MGHKKNFKDFKETNLLRIKLNLHHFSMTGSSGCNFPICRVFYMSATITGCNFTDTIQSQKYRFSTPKATSTKCGCLFIVCFLLCSVHDNCNQYKYYQLHFFNLSLEKTFFSNSHAKRN